MLYLGLMDNGVRVFSVRFPDALYNRLKRLSRHKHLRSVNRVILECLDRSLQQVEGEYPVGRDGQGAAQPVRRTTKRGDTGAAQKG
jgi:predicted DNA-binding protein